MGRTILVWLGAFGPKKPFGPTPGDAWISAIVIEDNDSGSVMAERCDKLKNDPGGICMVAPEHWKEEG